MKNNNHPVKNPRYYEVCGQNTLWLVEAFNFSRGNALKYIIRAGKKLGKNGQTEIQKEIQDLEKAIFYLGREVEKLKSPGQINSAEAESK